MKRVALCILAAMLLCGCAQSQEDPFKVDTVVQIPVDPTDAPTDEPTELPTETPTEAPTEEPTKPKETKPAKSGSSSKGSGSGGKNKPKETEPPVTELIIIETEAPTQAPTQPPFDPSTYSVGNLEYAILDALNSCRTAQEMGELSISGKLSGIAYLRAQEAAVSWSHTRPDGRNYTSALSDYGYGYGDAAELMVYTSGSGDGETMVSKWMDSESHSEKILSSSFTKVGIGVYYEDGVTYVVCLLAG